MRLAITVLVVGVGYLGFGCGDSHDGHDHHGHHGHHGHHDHSHDEVPDEYSELANPLPREEMFLELGAELWRQQCAYCHGENREGPPATVAQLVPQPNRLDQPQVIESMTDGYLFWRITEGGTSSGFESSMPAYGDVLSEEERWAIILMLRAQQ